MGHSRLYWINFAKLKSTNQSHAQISGALLTNIAGTDLLNNINLLFLSALSGGSRSIIDKVVVTLVFNKELLVLLPDFYHLDIGVEQLV